MRNNIKIIYSYFFILTLISFYCCNANGQGPWTQKADFGGGQRLGAVGFTIGSKIYLGLGNNGGSFKKDFWEYDPAANTWTQKADFVGAARGGAVGFCINTKGYIGTGYDGSYYKDFWEYDPATDTWTQKADFGGSARNGAVGFAIGNKGYIGTGTHTKDFWEYAPTTDTWTQKTDFGGTAREFAVGFSIGNKGYIGTGDFFDGTENRYKDFWEYDTITDLWTQKADFAGTARGSATGFSINSKGYIGIGYDGYYRNDFWEYDTSTNTWTQKAYVGGHARVAAVGFSIGNKGYIGTGCYDINSQPYFLKDFWEYNPETDGINEMKGECAISVYPNPFSDYTMLYLATSLYNATLCVYDIFGKEVNRMENLNGKEIRISRTGMCKGMYFFRVVDGNTISGQGKIIVE